MLLRSIFTPYMYIATGIRTGSLFFLVLNTINSSTPVCYLTAIQPGSQNTHTWRGQQRRHRYVSQKWPTCITKSLCKSELGTSIHGLLYFWGRSIQEMGGDVVIGGCCNRWVVILPILWYCRSWSCGLQRYECYKPPLKTCILAHFLGI